jgi:hypothetical protein
MQDRDEVREHVLADAQLEIRRMARRGMGADQIERELEARLNETERDLVWLLARHEIAHGPGSRLQLDSDEVILPAS